MLHTQAIVDKANPHTNLSAGHTPNSPQRGNSQAKCTAPTGLLHQAKLAVHNPPVNTIPLLTQIFRGAEHPPPVGLYLCCSVKAVINNNVRLSWSVRCQKIIFVTFSRKNFKTNFVCMLMHSWCRHGHAQ